MSVRFITFWNGYKFGDVATLDVDLETRLIAGLLARNASESDNAPTPALAFTDLADAPATLEPNSFLVPGAESFSWGKQLTVEDVVAGGGDVQARSQLSLTAFGEDYWPEGDANMYAVTQDGTSMTAAMFLTALADAGEATFRVDCDAGPTGTPAVTMAKVGACNFAMSGFDVAASDASAHMTVSGTQYSIAKAVKVVVDGQTYFWPLFGPVA